LEPEGSGPKAGERFLSIVLLRPTARNSFAELICAQVKVLIVAHSRVRRQRQREADVRGSKRFTALFPHFNDPAAPR
jgi:hypothetical protein